MRKYVLAVLLVLVMAAPAMAKMSLEQLGVLGQDNFKSFSTDFGMALSYVPLSPAEPLGGVLPGFDAGVEASAVKLDKTAAYWTLLQNAGANMPNSFLIPRVHVQVGLPVVPIDLGVSYSSVPSTAIKLVGAELKYAVFKGGVIMPAIALRGAYTKLSGISELDLSTKSVDVSISKGFLMFTPYLGVGNVWITSTPQGAPAQVLKEESISKIKSFVGAKFSLLPILNIVAEGDFSTVKEYSLRLNVHF